MNNIKIESATQLNKILSFLPDDRKNKIPNSVLKQIEDKIDNSIDTKIYDIKDIKEENLLPETRKYLSFIFLNYLATEEEKKEYTKILKENEIRYQEYLNKKYNTDNIFKNNIKNTSSKTELPIEYKERSLWKRIWNKIKKLYV